MGNHLKQKYKSRMIFKLIANYESRQRLAGTGRAEEECVLVSACGVCASVRVWVCVCDHVGVYVCARVRASE